VRRPLLLALPLLLAPVACGGDDEAAAPCDLLSPARVEALVGDGLERIGIADGLADDADEDARKAAADERSCVYAPAGTKVGGEPKTAVAVQIDHGLYDSKE
jgi:hypothetical protein